MESRRWPPTRSLPGNQKRGLPVRVTLVVGTTSGGTGVHVRMLAAGLAARGIAVCVLSPSAAGARFGFGAIDGVAFTPVEFGDRPRPRDVAAVLRLRREFSRQNASGHGSVAASGPPDVVHAHGLRAGALTVLALGRVRGSRRPRLVVTVHNAPPPGRGTSAVIYRLLERLVACGSDLVLCVSVDLEARLRAAGARRVDRAVVSAAGPMPSPGGDRTMSSPGGDRTEPIPVAPPTPINSSTPFAPSVPTAAPVFGAVATGRPVVLAVGRLAAQKEFGTLLEAAVTWRDMDTEPLLAIAGDGPLAGELRARASGLGVDVAFLGHRDDVGALLAAAAVFVLPSRWEGQPLVLQEALRAGVPIVATRTGGIPDLVGGDAALLVEPADAAGVASAVRAVLADPSLAAGLRAAAARRAATLPTQDDAVTAALSSYAVAIR
jgi:glycosyltransferase involved in cell wall biosynthesis